jgi:uncharacterized protein YndB with AHSA1/START domain
MLTGLVIVIVLVAATVLGLAALKPGSFRIARTDFVAAPPDKVFALVSDFHTWNQWSPWEALDPAMNRTFSGADRGIGAIYAWSGNKKVGEGRMEITGVEPDSRLTIKLDFMRPWKASNTAEFLLNARPEGTEVTWSMMGASPFMFKLMGLFMNMDQMVGRDFEKGLANLKAVLGGAQ